MSISNSFQATTICCVKKDGVTAMAGDGQMTFANSVVMKGNTKKIRSIANGKIITGFAGSTSDSMTLIERLEEFLDKNDNKLLKSCTDLAKYWRADKYRNLEAMMLVADKENMLLLSGSGDVIEPEHDIIAIGSGGQFAYSAGLALLENCNKMSALDIATKSIEVAGKICVFTNSNIISKVVQ